MDSATCATTARANTVEVRVLAVIFATAAVADDDQIISYGVRVSAPAAPLVLLVLRHASTTMPLPQLGEKGLHQPCRTRKLKSLDSASEPPPRRPHVTFAAVSPHYSINSFCV